MNEKLGPMTYGSDQDEVFLGRDYGRSQNYSEEVAATIDREMRKLIDVAYNKAERLLENNMDILERVAQALLEKETLNAREFEEIFLNRPLEPGEFDREYSKTKEYYHKEETEETVKESEDDIQMAEEGFKEEDIEKTEEKAEKDFTEEKEEEKE